MDKGPDYRAPIKNGLMHEKAGSRLPALDYRALQAGLLDRMVRGAKAPAGKYENLLTYIKQRSGKQLDADEVDRRMRTFFEDMITRVLKSPGDFDGDVQINGRALFDFLSGVPGPGQPKAPGAPGEGGDAR